MADLTVDTENKVFLTKRTNIMIALYDIFDKHMLMSESFKNSKHFYDYKHLSTVKKVKRREFHIDTT